MLIDIPLFYVGYPFLENVAVGIRKDQGVDDDTHGGRSTRRRRQGADDGGQDAICKTIGHGVADDDEEESQRQELVGYTGNECHFYMSLGRKTPLHPDDCVNPAGHS